MARVFDNRYRQPAERPPRLAVLYAALVATNLGAWARALIAFRHYPLLIGTSLLAYGLGLRHAIDADHIAAIDNVTRKLMHGGARPLATGFFFSLGHSTVVVLASIAIAATAMAFDTSLSSLRDVGGIIGTSVSALFLLAIANFGTIGYVIIGIFAVGWAASTVVYRVKKYDVIEATP